MAGKKKVIKTDQARQGDIYFKACKSPKGKKGIKRYDSPVMAYGEVTGHSHKIVSPSFSEMESFVDEKGDIFVMSPTQPIEVAHDEHSVITLDPGQWYCVSRQREYDPQAAERERQVAD
jgi:hypothetical protein